MKVATRRAAPQLDRMDMQHLQQTLTTRGYQIVHERLTEMLEHERMQLETLTGPELSRQQGRVAMLRATIALPRQLLESLRARHS